MGDIVQGNFGALSPVFKQAAPEVFGDLQGGITMGFGTVRYKGKVWKVKHQGAEHLWRGADGQPAASVEVVLVNASSNISKQFYEGKFVEGAEVGAPTCWSVNGIAPDAAAPKKQHSSCVACPKNAWGSRIADNGKQAKACSDRRRVAIMPITMLASGLQGPFNGPLLLTVPPTSLKDLAAYQRQAQALGFPYYAVVTRISFDINVAHPKLVFTAVRPLNDDEAAMVIELAQDEYTQRMLSTAVDEEVATGDDQPTAAGFFEQGATAKPAATVAAKPQPVQEQVIDAAFTEVSPPPVTQAPAQTATAADPFGAGAQTQAQPAKAAVANPFAPQAAAPAQSAATKPRAARPKPVETPAPEPASTSLDEALGALFGG